MDTFALHEVTRLRQCLFGIPRTVLDLYDDRSPTGLPTDLIECEFEPADQMLPEGSEGAGQSNQQTDPYRLTRH